MVKTRRLYSLRYDLFVISVCSGMWQVSGRSDITDFEEVVRLDKEYITNWNIGLDIKILFKTILVVFRKDGINVNPTSSLFYRGNKLQKDKNR